MVTLILPLDTLESYHGRMAGQCCEHNRTHVPHGARCMQPQRD
jgi:hypothetical protein